MSEMPLVSVCPQDCRQKMTMPDVWRITRRLFSVAIVLFAGTVTWVCLLYLPRYAGGSSLDESWAQALGYFLTHRFQAGQDYIFTFGPLGYFFTPIYDKDLFWYKCVWEWVIKFLYVV